MAPYVQPFGDLDMSKMFSRRSTSASPSLSGCRPPNVPENTPLQERNSVKKKRSTLLSLTNLKWVANQEASEVPKSQTQLPLRHFCISLTRTHMLSHRPTCSHTDPHARSHGLPSNVSSFCSISNSFTLLYSDLSWKISSVADVKGQSTTESRSPWEPVWYGTPQTTLRNTNWVSCFWRQCGEEKSRVVLILEI